MPGSPSADASGDGIARRHVAYRTLDELFRCGTGVPDAVHGTRFFAAAALVTAPAALGQLERRVGVWRWLERLGIVDAGARRHVVAINAHLLTCNLAVAAALLFDWRELRSPLTGLGPALTAPAFDAAMVVHEQRSMDDYLARHPMSEATRRGIDRLLALCAQPWCRRALDLDPALCAAVGERAAEASPRASFFCIATRIAIGQALLRRLHAETVVARR